MAANNILFELFEDIKNDGNRFDDPATRELKQMVKSGAIKISRDELWDRLRRENVTMLELVQEVRKDDRVPLKFRIIVWKTIQVDAYRLHVEPGYGPSEATSSIRSVTAVHEVESEEEADRAYGILRDKFPQQTQAALERILARRAATQQATPPKKKRGYFSCFYR